jgi:hypothetical protein
MHAQVLVSQEASGNEAPQERSYTTPGSTDSKGWLKLKFHSQKAHTHVQPLTNTPHTHTHPLIHTTHMYTHTYTDLWSSQVIKGEH